VPLIVISPLTPKPAYISHVNHDFGSILKFVEEVFGLPSLGYADTHALDDLAAVSISVKRRLYLKPSARP
jgi:hypothetical protein